ncbi:MAG: hypothetical protein ACK5LL_13780 [Suipraeoptans sp.]
MDELDMSMQVLKLVGSGAVMLGKCSLSTYQKLKAIEHAKILDKAGQVNYEKLINHKGEDIVVIDIRTQDEKQLEGIKKNLQERKVMFVQMPDMDLSDGRTQFMISSSDVSKVNAFYRQYPNFQGEKNMTLDDYVNTGSDEQWKKVNDSAITNIKKEAKENKQQKDVSQEEMLKKKKH